MHTSATYQFSLRALRTVLIVATAYGVWWLFTSIPHWSCQRSAAMMGLEGKFIGFSGCYMLTPSGRWMPENSIRYDIRTDRIGTQ